MSEFSRRMWEVTDTSENLKSSLQRSERERTTLSNDLCKTKARLEEECGTSSAQRTELHTLRVDHSEMKERTAMMERDLLVTRRELALKNKDAQAAVALRIQVEKSEEEKREAYAQDQLAQIDEANAMDERLRQKQRAARRGAGLE